MPISGIGAPQCGQGKVSSVTVLSSSAPDSAEPSSASHSSRVVLKEGGTSLPQFGQGRCPRRLNRIRRYVYTSVAVPTVERGLWLVRCWSTLIVGESPVMDSTGGFVTPQFTNPSDSKYWR